MAIQAAPNIMSREKGRETFANISSAYDELPQDVKSSGESLGSKQKMFMNVIAASMKNPSPLSNKDPEDTIMQMMQMHQIDSSERTVEGISKLKEEILKLVKFGQASIQGKQVKIKSNLLLTQDGKAKFEFDNPTDLKQLKVTITTDKGKPIKTFEIDPEVDDKPNPLYEKGTHFFEWDGKDMHDCDVSMGPNDKYKIKILAKGMDDKYVNVSTKMIGEIDGIDFTTRNSDVRIGSQTFPVEMLEIYSNENKKPIAKNDNKEVLSALSEISKSLKPPQPTPLNKETRNAIYGY